MTAPALSLHAQVLSLDPACLDLRRDGPGHGAIKFGGLAPSRGLRVYSCTSACVLSSPEPVSAARLALLGSLHRPTLQCVFRDRHAFPRMPNKMTPALAGGGSGNGVADGERDMYGGDQWQRLHKQQSGNFGWGEAAKKGEQRRWAMGVVSHLRSDRVE